jgi:hypothetical protein
MPSPPIRPRAKKPGLTVGQILGWADAFHRKHGRWPTAGDGLVEGTADQTWKAADASLRRGNRGLPGGSSLAKLLLTCRGRRHWHLTPDLTVDQILAWADAHFQRTGGWPTGHCTDQIPKAPKGTTWVAVGLALIRGRRGLPGGDSLANLLETHRGVRNRLSAPGLTEEQILAWADDHHGRTGEWPKYQDGPITAAPGETWHAVNTALSRGTRGLPGDDTLAKLLARNRGVRNKSELPHLTVGQVKAWAEAHKGRTGGWPAARSGPIPEAPGETWSGVNAALIVGMRGFPGGDSLARLLARECGRRNLGAVPRLSLRAIRRWVRDHHAATGKWPTYTAGPIAGAPGETWGAVANALTKGRRGLPGGMTLGQVVRACRGGSSGRGQ